MDLGERLRQARQEAGLTLERAADAVGTTANTVWRYETGHRNPSRLALFALSTLYNKSIEWLYGEEEESTEQSFLPKTQTPDSAMDSQLDSPDVAASLVEMHRNLSTRFDRLESAFSRIAEADIDNTSSVRPVEVVEIAAAAGGGAEVYDETIVGRLWFRRDWLDRNNIDPGQCNVISVSGESMEPVLPSGCSILVDRSQGRKRRRVGRIFVLRTEDGLVVKRLGKDENGQWQIESEHPAWLPVSWSDDVEVIGEVRWMARTF